MKKNSVAVFMGSKSDYPIMEKTCQTLKELGIDYCVTVASAHRSPKYLCEKIKECEEAGVLVYIAGAGMAAHLPGVIAGMTAKPVIAVPINSKLMGIDSLLSIVQMPSGVPVATMAVDGAVNGAILAAQILSLSDEKLSEKLILRRKEA
ncbi:MAG: 5-(carboxyamino)imidazole ribonucleotide mutase, partial [Elusimicrobia bacterium]|nr:5-(carboxyamino)imidazole ribonucleotide mutase [Elusimicrobiota bacterium]